MNNPSFLSSISWFAEHFTVIFLFPSMLHPPLLFALHHSSGELGNSNFPMRNAQNLDVRTTRTYHKCLGRVPRLAGNSGGWRRVSTNLHSTRTAECDHKSLRAVRLKNPCLCLGSSHVHSMGLQFSVKPSGNSIRDRNSYLNTGKSNHCPPDG